MLKPCPECKESISSEAKKCLYCGFPLQRSSPIGMLSALVFLIGAPIFIFGAFIGQAWIAALGFVLLLMSLRPI